MRRSGNAGAGQPALALAAAAVFTLAAVEIALVGEGAPGPVWAGVVYVLVGLEYLSLGVLTWSRRPVNLTGGLLCLCALSILLSGLQNTSSPVLVGIGLILDQSPIAVLVHLVLAFPAGRLPDRRSRLLCVGGYLITLVLPAPSYLFAAAGSVPDWVHVADSPGLVTGFAVGQRIVAIMVIGAIAVLWIFRIRRSPAGQAPVLASVSGYGVFTLLWLDLSANITALLGLGLLVRFILQVTVFAGVPVVFAIAIIRGGFARAGGVASLAVWLGAAEDTPSSLRDALAHALGDPSVELWFWLPDRQAYVDADGRQVQPRTGGGRASVEVDLAGDRLGLIGYDGDLTARPDQVRSAARLVGLAMDRERMVAELLANRAAIRDSLTRIVEAGDQERRRIARDLHDGLQGQLVVLAVRAGRLASDAAAEPATDPGTATAAAGLRADAETAIATLREVVHGIIPALLVDRGLYAATEDLVDRLPIAATLELPTSQHRLPTAVETAGYFTVAEAITNAVKHAHADRLQIRLDVNDHRQSRQLRIEVRDDGVGGADAGRNGGLRGISDRIEGVGGRLSVHSPPGEGTTVVAEVPCGS